MALAQVIRALRQEQEALARRLRFLEHQIDALQGHEQPDFDVIVRTFEHCLSHVVASQSLEIDLILNRLRVRKETAAEAVGARTDEHDKLAALTRGFSQAVEDRHRRAADNRDELDRLCRASVLAFWDYMHRTEQLVLPVALLMLTEEDWAKIDAQLNSRKTADQTNQTS